MYKIKDSPAKRKLSWKKVKSKMMDDAMTLSRTHTLTQTHTHTYTRLHDTPIDREMNEMAEWHFVLPCERSIKIFPGGGLLDSSNRFRLPASSLKVRFKDFFLSRRWYVASSTTVWQYPLGLGRVNGWGCWRKLQKLNIIFIIAFIT